MLGWERCQSSRTTPLSWTWHGLDWPQNIISHLVCSGDRQKLEACGWGGTPPWAPLRVRSAKQAVGRCHLGSPAACVAPHPSQPVPSRLPSYVRWEKDSAHFSSSSFLKILVLSMLIHSPSKMEIILITCMILRILTNAYPDVEIKTVSFLWRSHCLRLQWVLPHISCNKYFTLKCSWLFQ